MAAGWLWHAALRSFPPKTVSNAPLLADAALAAIAEHLIPLGYTIYEAVPLSFAEHAVFVQGMLYLSVLLSKVLVLISATDALGHSWGMACLCAALTVLTMPGYLCAACQMRRSISSSIWHALR